MNLLLGHVLNESDLQVLQSLLVPEASQSFVIGTQLGLPVGVVEALENNSPSDIFKFQLLVLTKWLQCKDPPPTIEKLVDVLSGPVINNDGLAKDIKQHFGLT